MQRVILVLILLTSSLAEAAIIIRAKANKCLIHLEGEETFPGDKFFALNLLGEKVGIVEIEKAKNGKAIGRVLQGVVSSNWILEKTSQKSPSLDTVQKTSVVQSQTLRNSIGLSFMGIFNRLIYNQTQGARNQAFFNSFSGGGSLFTNYKLSSKLMLHLQFGGEYVALRESARNQQRSVSNNYQNTDSDRQSNFLIWSLPITLQYYIPMNLSQVKMWLGAGLSVNYWGAEYNSRYGIFSARDFNRLSNSGHIALGLDYYPSQTHFYIPIRIQGTSHFALDFIQKSILSNERNNLVLNALSIYIGIARHI